MSAVPLPLTAPWQFTSALSTRDMSGLLVERKGVPWKLRGSYKSGKNGPNYVVVSLNYCSQNGGNLYRAP